MKPTPNNNIELQDEITKIHNTAETSIESFIKVNNTGLRLVEKQRIFEAIKANQPVTSRKLATITGAERTSVTRSLYDLIHEISPQIKEAFTAKCPVTNRRVKYYTLIDWAKIGGENE